MWMVKNDFSNHQKDVILMFCFPCLFAKDQASARRTGAGRALAGTRQQAIEPG